MLVEKGADKDKARNDGASPLYIAALNGRLGVVQLLVELGVDKDKAMNGGWMPLHAAAEQGHLEVVGHLLEHETGE